jgi:hypothetical protein
VRRRAEAANTSRPADGPWSFAALVELHDDLSDAARVDFIGVERGTYHPWLGPSIIACTSFLTTTSSKSLLENSSSRRSGEWCSGYRAYCLGPH